MNDPLARIEAIGAHYEQRARGRYDGVEPLLYWYWRAVEADRREGRSLQESRKAND